MGLRLFGIPLKWSALRYTLRDVKTDRSLKSDEGRAEFRSRMLAEGKEWASVCLLRQVLDVPGDVIECGVYRGHSLIRLAMAMSEYSRDKTLYALDSFDGFPPGSVCEVDVPERRNKARVNRKFQLADKVPIRLQRIAKLFDLNIQLRPGFFHETLPQMRDRKFCFIHLDCDIYESYKTCLNELYGQLAPGGLIVFDEYKNHVWPGASRAIDEFFADKPEKPEYYSTETGSFKFKARYFVRKSALSGRSSADNSADAA